ncbi:MAG: sugar phosphate permease [Chloroflexi bacterium RBG_19FT_COMBO_55_16]|nr:MAG: sugar phosphate permease [Chloroflexi bacterium RBG_19FT_COMBO_55_16]
MAQETFKIYGYRWIILLAFMAVVAVNQLMWITFAPITSSAASYYEVSDLSIGLLSMSFMIVYIFVSIPASWLIDTVGFRVAVGIGAALTGIFGLTRGWLAANYSLVLISQIGIAIGQPFILNAVTKVAARWFPLQERATATGLGSLAMYLGIVLGLALTPYLVIRSSIDNVLLIYGIVSVIAAIFFLVLAKEHPPTPACPPGQELRSLVFTGLKDTLRKVDFILLMVIFFIGLGVFNGVTTWIEDILRPRGFSITQAGIAGGLMVFGGVVGAVILPSLSDRYRKRVPFILIALAGSILGLLGITFANSYTLLLAAAFVMGFFLLSAGPIGFQYGAEIAYPTPEGSSNGLLILMGQISGILFIFGMDSFKTPGTGSMTASLLVLVGLMVLGLLISTRLKESSLLTGKLPE